MKKMFRFAKKAALVLAGVSLVVSCQKDNEQSKLDSVGGVKYALDVTTPGHTALFGDYESWLDAGAPLSYLEEGKNQSGNFDFALQPTGVKITKDTRLYLTFVGNIAAFNNVLGYYTYTEEQLTRALYGKSGDALVEAYREFILNQIFENGNNGPTYKNVVYAQTRTLGFGTTYEISAEQNKDLKAGTIVGFYLLPNGGANDAIDHNGTIDANELNVMLDMGGRPKFLATDPIVNVDYNESGNIIYSHLVGQSSCGDVVIAFEDLNTNIISYKPDNDYNDLVFVVGSNLDSRRSRDFEPYKADGQMSYSLKLLGDVADCDECQWSSDVIEESWFGYSGFLVEGQCITEMDEYAEVFLGKSQAGYIEIINDTKVYAVCQNSQGAAFVNLGWYYYTGPNQTLAEIGASITDANGIIKDEYLLYKNTQLTKGTIPQTHVPFNGGNEIEAGSKIGFFMIAGANAQQGGIKFESQSNKSEIRTTTIPNNLADSKKAQAQMLLKSFCDSYLISFEDMILESDFDFNDITFSIMDNPDTNFASNFVVEGYYPLYDLLHALGIL